MGARSSQHDQHTHLGRSAGPSHPLPFLAVVILGVIVVARREQRRGTRAGPGILWLATLGGLMYPGGATMTLVQMIRVIQFTGIVPAAAITLHFAAVPAVLGMFTLRLIRRPAPLSRLDRIFLLLIGGTGLLFLAGLIIGPVCIMMSALVPDRLRDPP